MDWIANAVAHVVNEITPSTVNPIHTIIPTTIPVTVPANTPMARIVSSDDANKLQSNPYAVHNGVYQENQTAMDLLNRFG